MNYMRLWKYFLKYEATEFIKERSLSLEEIKKIGIKKFIRANGWSTEEDIKKWRTDVCDVIPCPVCSRDFGIQDLLTMGMCDNCRKKYTLRKFYVLLQAAATPLEAARLLSLFFTSKEFRNTVLVRRDKK